MEPIGSTAELDDALDLNARVLARRFDGLVDAHGGIAQERCLALPDPLPTGVRAVVDQARQRGVEATCETLADERAAVAFLLDYFADERFAYDLEAPDGDGRDNMRVVDDFLKSGRGYCLHYASAMTVPSRALGVPARLVLGYRAGNARASDGSYLVTNRNLHAWTEVYLDGVGWLPIDVTPARGSSAGRTPAASDEPDEVPDGPREPGDAAREDERRQPDGEGEERADDSDGRANAAPNAADTDRLADAVRFARDRVLPAAVPAGAVALSSRRRLSFAAPYTPRACARSRVPRRIRIARRRRHGQRCELEHGASAPDGTRPRPRRTSRAPR
ncbi:transglutaminase-like domain-containing protein [Collinsella tanakaei]|uniref:transglutaminase-like domain-containing protein n=1 Tax=Collinsella tanakaei TaxID=626935 RepID=UPI0025A42302|nr:transglutaminase-like domain-containing protein [Collinsella tanakaei]MDM8301809.1 transglutaminase-like domain-containing protein [Collinsella tanakaei]